MKLDFDQLYAQLRVQPDCSLEAFKHAYRRCVAEQHPDRGLASATNGGTHMPFGELTSLYGQALEFHRRYGRLPGSRQRAAEQAPRPAQALPPAPTPDPGTQAADINPPQRGVLLLFAIMLAVIAFFSLPQRPEQTAPLDPDGTAKHAPSDTPRILKAKMDEVTVLAIQGEPVERDRDLWHYGPSWLRFEKGRLVEWHSSPLRPLKIAARAPMDSAEDSPR